MHEIGHALMTVDDPETIEVRRDERLDLAHLEPWLREHLDGADGPLEVRQFGGGHANLTYLLDFGGREFVLRRPPLGPVAPSAHDMKREHMVLSGLWQAFPLAPRSYVLCTDHNVLGADFHVMERKEGFVVRKQNDDLLDGKPELCARIGHMIIDVLADLHSVKPEEVGLAELGRPEGFVARQVEGWVKRWNAALDDTAPDAADVIAWLQADVPSSPQVSLIHNDFKLDNMMVATGDLAEPRAVLDWDMCTRGDPLMDLGTLLNYWVDADDPEAWRQVAPMPSTKPGFPTRAQVAERYGQRTGFNLSRLAWYQVFGAFKIAVILQQIYIRYLRGQTRDERFSDMGGRVQALIGNARRAMPR